MIVYVDVLFIENFILDFIIILATVIICNNKFKIWRLILGSCIGSILTTVCIILNINNFILKILISIVIILISCGFKKIKRFLKNLSVFYLTTITFGGVSFMLLFSVNPKEIIYSAGKFLGLYPVKIAILGGIFGFCLIVLVQKMLKKKLEKICEIEIFYNGKNVKTKALIDSRKFA